MKTFTVCMSVYISAYFGIHALKISDHDSVPSLIECDTILYTREWLLIKYFHATPPPPKPISVSGKSFGRNSSSTLLGAFSVFDALY
jgi:hypothetical protein